MQGIEAYKPTRCDFTDVIGYAKSCVSSANYLMNSMAMTAPRAFSATAAERFGILARNCLDYNEIPHDFRDRIGYAEISAKLNSCKAVPTYPRNVLLGL